MCQKVYFFKEKTMVYYTKDEIQSSTSVSRNFGSLLDSLRSKKLNKVAILRNNIMEAVIIPLEEYERLKAKQVLEEHSEIYEIVKKREKENLENAVPLEDVLIEYGLNSNEI